MRLKLLAVMALVAVQCGGWLGAAGAAPAMPAEMPGAVDLRLADIGVPDPVGLSGAIAERTFSVPVPPGLRPQRLLARLDWSPSITAGELSMESAGVRLTSLRMPPAGRDVTVYVGHAPVRDGRLTITIRAILNPETTLCASALTRVVEFSNLRLRFSGSAVPPATVGAFWPIVLTALTIDIPARPSAGEAAAALTLAAAAARMAVGHPVDVAIQTIGAFSPVSPADPFQRVALIREGPRREARLIRGQGIWPALAITAPSAELPGFTELVVDAHRSLLFSRVARVQGEAAAQARRPDQITLADLGHPQINVQGAGQMDMQIPFSQSDFGGPVSGVVARLAGTYLPVPEGGVASLAVLLNGGFVQGEQLGNNGRFDLYVSFPGSLLRRDNTLTVRVLYTPPGGNCRVGTQELLLRLDGASYLQVERGQRIAPGFERFPQVLLPEFLVTLEPMTADAVGAAARVVTALQRLSRLPLRLRIAAKEEALKSTLPVLAVALDPGRAGGWRPPLEPSPFRLVDVDGHELLRMDAASQFALLEAYQARGRDVLLLTHRTFDAGIDQLNRQLSSSGGWYELDGDLWVARADGLPFTLRLHGGPLRVDRLPGSRALWWVRMRPIAFALAIVVVLVFLYWAHPRVVRTMPKP